MWSFRSLEEMQSLGTLVPVGWLVSATRGLTLCPDRRCVVGFSKKPTKAILSAPRSAAMTLEGCAQGVNSLGWNCVETWAPFVLRYQMLT